MSRTKSTEIDHIDPRWVEGRDYQLVCGLDCPLNYREEDWIQNTIKSNRFLPWRWVRDEVGVVPSERGDLALFLVGADIENDVPGEWVLLEFLSDDWFVATKSTCGSSARKKGVSRPDLVLKQWETLRDNPEILQKRNDRIRETMRRVVEENPDHLKSAQEGHQRHRRENPEFWDEMNRQLSIRSKKLRAEKPELFEQGCKDGGKLTGNRKFRCTLTGKILGPGPLTQYQNSRGIDTSNRVELTPEELAAYAPPTPEERKIESRQKALDRYYRSKNKQSNN